MRLIKMFSVLGLICASVLAHADGIITAARVAHGSSNLSATTWTSVIGTIVAPARHIEVSNSQFSGTVEVSIGCNYTNQITVLYMQPNTPNHVVPLSMSKGQCLKIRGAAAAVTTGDSTYTLLGAE